MNAKKNDLAPLMPKATAKWLIDNTYLTIKQIADFCVLPLLEVKAIADGIIANNIIGMDPVMNAQLTRQEIDRCQKNPAAKLMLSDSAQKHNKMKKTKKSRYTPMSRRAQKPDGIAWLLRNCPDIPDGKIIKLIGTTKKTIESIKDRTHRNMNEIKPRDPVLLGLCTQTDLNNILELYSKKSEEDNN